MGSGYEPGQELYVLLQLAGGTGLGAGASEGSIGDYALDSLPFADERGNFASLFTVDRLERVTAEGVWRLTVTDVDRNVLAVTSIGFADPEGNSRVGIYPEGERPDYSDPDETRPAPWLYPFFDYPEMPEEEEEDD